MLDSRLPHFRTLSPQQRRDWLCQACHLSDAERALLDTPSALSMESADGMIENVFSTFALPLGLAGNFQINGRDVLIPMVVEEPSVVAAASYMARLARAEGGFQTSSTAPLMRAQVQVVGLTDPHGARLALLQERTSILARANACDQHLCELGGGCRDIEVHVFENTPRGAMLVLHLIVDVRDAMGANTVNTMAEQVAPLVEQITTGRVRLRILSNLADLRLARARVRLTAQTLTTQAYSGADIIEGILDAHTFAATDPYRAATHNKGIMNGIDPIVLATGNDWRAVEAGAHAWACRSGCYRPLTCWEQDAQGALVGAIELPMPVGIVGGATKTHPQAQLALKIMGITCAQALGEIAAAVGLAQNLAALRALATEGIQRGHMALHARNIAIACGAVGEEVTQIAKQLAAERDVRSDRALQLLQTLRDQAH